MLQQLVWILHLACAICIIILVLLQYGKGAEMGASMGGASQTIFGSRGSGSFMTKITTIFALIFATTSISLSFFVNRQSQIQTISEVIQESEFPEETNFTLENEESMADLTESEIEANDKDSIPLAIDKNISKGKGK